MIRGKNINIRGLEKTDLKFTYKWANDPDITYYVGYNYPISMEEELKWFERIVSDQTRKTFLVESKDGKPIGLCGYENIDWKNSMCEEFIQIGEKEFWGKGYGTDIQHTMLYHAFNRIGYNRVYGFISDYNIGAVKMDLKAGFRNEGTLKEAFLVNGKYHDRIIVGVIKKDFNKRFGYSGDENFPEVYNLSKG